MAKKTTEKDRSGQVEKDLTATEVKERADELAKKELRYNVVEKEKKEANKKWTKELAGLKDRIATLAEEVDSGKAWVSAQMQFGDRKPVDLAAKRAQKDKKEKKDK